MPLPSFPKILQNWHKKEQSSTVFQVLKANILSQQKCNLLIWAKHTLTIQQHFQQLTVFVSASFTISVSPVGTMRAERGWVLFTALGIWQVCCNSLKVGECKMPVHSPILQSHITVDWEPNTRKALCWALREPRRSGLNSVLKNVVPGLYGHRPFLTFWWKYEHSIPKNT